MACSLSIEYFSSKKKLVVGQVDEFIVHFAQTYLYQKRVLKSQ